MYLVESHDRLRDGHHKGLWVLLGEGGDQTGDGQADTEIVVVDDVGDTFGPVGGRDDVRVLPEESQHRQSGFFLDKTLGISSGFRIMD